MTQTVVIKKAESGATHTFGIDDLMSLSYNQTMNEGATAITTITFDYGDNNKNPLSPQFLWSDGSKRSLRKGDYFFIYDNANRKFYGRISLIRGEEHLLTIEAIDLVYQLRGIGHTYIRDHYGDFIAITRPLWKEAIPLTDPQKYRIIIEVPEDINVMQRMFVFGREGGEYFNLLTNNQYGFKQYHIQENISPNFAVSERKYSIKMKVPGFPANSQSNQLSLKVRYEFNPIHPGLDGYITVYDENFNNITNSYDDTNMQYVGIDGKPIRTLDRRATLTRNLIPGETIYIQVTGGTWTGDGDIFGNAAHSFMWLFGDYADFNPADYDVRTDFRTYLWGHVNPNQDTPPPPWKTHEEMASTEMYNQPGDLFPNIVFTVDPPYGKLYEVSSYEPTGRVADGSLPGDGKVKLYEIKKVNGLEKLDETTLFLGLQILGGIIYAYTGEISKMTIARDILMANNIPFTTTSSMTKMLSFFRCGGAAISDYLKMLVDIINDDGKNNTMFTNLISGSIVFGVRNSLYLDSPQKALIYGTDKIIDFNHTKNLSWKYVTGAIKGAESSILSEKDEKYPIMLCMTDVASLKEQGGLNNSKLSQGSGASVLDMAVSLYSDIAANVSKDWTASITLSGINYSFFETNDGAKDIGSGKIVAVTNPVIGVSNYKMLVYSVEYDYAAHTTKLTLNSYPTEYVNRITNTENMVVIASNTMFDISGDNEVLQQYYYVESISGAFTDKDVDDIILTTEFSGLESPHKPDRIYTQVMPNLKSVLVTSVYYPKNIVIDDHGVTKISIMIKDTPYIHLIPEVSRPDWLPGQSLTINSLFYYG